MDPLKMYLVWAGVGTGRILTKRRYVVAAG
jgi:hypothetical protein